VNQANATKTNGTGFLESPAPSAEAQRLYDHDVERLGFVMNLPTFCGAITRRCMPGCRSCPGSGEDAAADVLRGADDGLDPAERAPARWARMMTRQPSSTEAKDVRPLRHAGFDDPQIFAITVLVAARLAFAFVNAALGARPDAELCAITPASVRNAVTYGRPPAPDLDQRANPIAPTNNK
jgi:hypothetical protein